MLTIFNSCWTERYNNLNESQATEEFAKYFNTHYVPRAEQWATCFRYQYVSGKLSSNLEICLHEGMD